MQINGNSKRAFTLIELLVVIAIIAILAAILFPVFASAKVAARKTGCSSNMHQIGIGLAMYADDYDGLMPTSSHGGGFEESSWILQLRPYLANTDEIRICPADPRKAEKLAELGTSYVLNEYLVVPGVDEQLNLHLVPRPSETITTFIASDEMGTTWQSDHTHSRAWFNRPVDRAWRRVLDDIQPDRHRVGVGEGLAGRTEGASNYLYADTHVTSIPAGRIKGWVDQRFNCATPPAE